MARAVARYGLIEAGGTKFVLGIAQGDASQLAGTPAARIIARHQIATTTPVETLATAVAWFREQDREGQRGPGPNDDGPNGEARSGAGRGGEGRGGEARHGDRLARHRLQGLGIASFGPLCLDRGDPQWGHITRTTKPGWSNTDVAGAFAAALGCEVAIDTDVNAAALAESRWGAGAQGDSAQGNRSLLYLTIGTGIGGGFVTASGALLRGLSHPEMGHIRLPRHPGDTAFTGICHFHGDCLEGLASGPAVIARWGQSLSELPADHPGADIIAWYLGQAICSFQAVLEPARIVLGGGVMGTPGLLAKVREAAVAAGAGYFAGDPADMILLPALWPDSGLLGGLALILGR